ncbi:MAG: hypothetical protein RLN60_00550 [Phycisphaerales bacterium]
MSAKHTARLAAVFLVTLVVGLLVWSELARRGQVAPGGTPAMESLPTPGEGNDTASRVESPDGIQDLIDMGEQGVWTNDDPEVGLIRIRWDALDPQPNGLFLVDKPHATISLENVRIEIRAEAGRLVWPARGLDQDREPESGTLTGDVVITLHDPDAPIDTSPTVRFATDSLNFDTTLGEIKTADAIRVENEQIRYTGEGLSVRYSQTPWRLTSLRVSSNSEVAFLDSEPAVTPATGSRGASGASPDADALAEIYRVTLRERVRLTSEFAELEAEEILVLARLLDGALPDGAIAEFRSTLPKQPGVASSSAPGGASGALAEPMTLAWAGPLEIRPIREVPPALAEQDVHLTIRSPESNRVQLTDLGSGSVLRCVGMEYGATTRDLSVYGIGGIGVRVDIPTVGEALFGRLDLDLTTGEGSIPGPIRVTSLRGGEPSRLRLTALNGASFLFNTEFGPVGAGGIVDPTEIIVRERVEATDGRRLVVGDTARALFTRRTAAAPGVDPQLARLLVEGAAQVADTESDERIAADTLDVAFDLDHPSDALVPRFATAQGDVRATQAGRTITARTLEASFVQNDLDETDLAAVSALRDVVVTTPDGERIECDSLASDERSGVIEIVGAPFRVTTRDRALAREFSAESARYERDRSYLTVFGGGTASQRALDAQSQEFEAIVASWANAMTFDELAGVIELQGDATLTAENAGVERHVARGHIATINLSSKSEGASTFLGAALEALDDANPATLELKRFAPGSADDTQRLANLRAGRIELDAIESTMTVPGPGLLVIDDRAPSEKSGEGDPFAFGSGGSTLFEWERSLAFDRGDGLALMRGRVRVLHKALGASELTQLECEQLAALISEPPRGRAGSPELVRVDATDAVYAKQGPVEIVADVMTYFGPAARIDAKANENNLVTIRDDRQNRHISAQSVSLDVKTGNWRVTDASPVTSPD